jgi:hypothetical protein
MLAFNWIVDRHRGSGATGTELAVVESADGAPEPEPEPQTPLTASQKKRAKAARQKARKRAEELAGIEAKPPEPERSGAIPKGLIQGVGGSLSEIIGREHGRIVKPAAESAELAQLAQEQMEIAEEEMSKNCKTQAVYR